MPAFKFLADHRIIKASLKIVHRSKYQNYRNKKEGKRERTRPIHQIREANEYSLKQIEQESGKREDDVQEMYNIIEKANISTNTKYGKIRKKKPDDELTEETKRNDIEKRNQLIFKEDKTIRERIKLSELYKITRREIRKDICRKIRRRNSERHY